MIKKHIRNPFNHSIHAYPFHLPDELGSDGKITWKMALKPGEKKEVTFGILVEYPKEREINGL